MDEVVTRTTYSIERNNNNNKKHLLIWYSPKLHFLMYSDFFKG